MDTEDVGAGEEDIAEALAENETDCVDTVDDAESTLDALFRGADEEEDALLAAADLPTKNQNESG